MMSIVQQRKDDDEIATIPIHSALSKPSAPFAPTTTRVSKAIVVKKLAIDIKKID